MTTETENPLGQNPFCSRKDCGGMADFEIGFKIWASAIHKVKVPDGAAEVFLPLSTCAAHAKEINIAEFFGNEQRESISRVFKAQQRAVPDWGTVELVLKPIKRATA